MHGGSEKSELPWFYQHQGRIYGPLSKSQLVEAAAAGKLLVTDEVWRADMQFRICAADVEGLFLNNKKLQEQQQIHRKQVEIIHALKKTGLEKSFVGASGLRRGREEETDARRRWPAKWKLACAFFALLLAAGSALWLTQARKQGGEADADLPLAPYPLITVMAQDNVLSLLQRYSFSASLEVPDKDGRTPLLLAVMQSRPALVKRLLEVGAQPNTRENLYRASPLHFAAVVGTPGVVDALIKQGADVLARDADGMTALHKAVGFNRREAASLLLAAGADPNAADANGRTPLHVGVLSNRPELVDLLLKSGADHNIKDGRGRMPLHLAAWHGRETISELLLRHGANASPMGGEQWDTPLHLAARAGNSNVVAVLLQHGAEPNVRNKAGMTPLLLAAACGSEAVCLQLAAAGANVELRNVNDGRSALDWAAWHGMAAFLRAGVRSAEKANAPNWLNRGNQMLHLVAANNHCEAAKVLLHAGALVDGPNAYGMTPLHVAVDGGHPEMVALLLDKGADINRKTISGWSPLHVAAARGRLGVGQLLAAHHNLNFNLVDLQGRTPLAVARQYKQGEMADWLEKQMPAPKK